MANDDWRDALGGVKDDFKARKAAGLSLSPAQFATLAHLSIFVPGATPGDLANEFGLPPDQIAKIVRGLLDEEFIAGVPGERDRRVKHLYVTDHGWSLAEAYLRQRGINTPDRSEIRIAKINKPRIRGGETV